MFVRNMPAPLPKTALATAPALVTLSPPVAAALLLISLARTALATTPVRPVHSSPATPT